MPPSGVTAIFCIATFCMPPEAPSREDVDLPELATITEAYFKSIRTLWLRTESEFPEPGPRELDKSLYGPGDRTTNVYVSEGTSRHYESVTELATGRVTRSKYYKPGADLWLFLTVEGDKRTTVDIENAELTFRPELLGLFYGRYGKPLYELLRGSDCTLLGAKQVDGVQCYAVEVREPPLAPRVVWYLDPEHDFLCRRKEFLRDDSVVSRIAVDEFGRVNDRWFPMRSTRESSMTVRGTEAKLLAKVKVVDVRINEPIDAAIFQPPAIPYGARVRDTRGPAPKEYIEGGRKAFEETWSKDPKPAPTGGARIVVRTPVNWTKWLTVGLAMIAGLILLYAAKVRWARS